MDLQKMIADLEAERDRLDKAILALEQLSKAEPEPSKRGRPRKWLRDKGGSAETTNGASKFK